MNKNLIDALKKAQQGKPLNAVEKVELGKIISILEQGEAQASSREDKTEALKDAREAIQLLKKAESILFRPVSGISNAIQEAEFLIKDIEQGELDDYFEAD